MKENAIKIIKVMLTLICCILLSLMYLPYLAILFGMLAILLPAAIIMSPFIFAENYFKRKEENEKQKARDELWQKFKKGEIDEDEYKYELEFLN